MEVRLRKPGGLRAFGETEVIGGSATYTCSGDRLTNTTEEAITSEFGRVG